MKTHVAINGAAGRMGQRLVCLAREDRALSVVAALEAPGHPAQGERSRVVDLADHWLAIPHPGRGQSWLKRFRRAVAGRVHLERTEHILPGELV